MRFELSIARRLFGERDDARRISRPAVRIAMWGVAVGLAVMLLSVFIVIGFKNEIRDKAMGFASHIQVQNVQTLFGGESAPVVVDKLFMHHLSRLPGIAHVQRYADKAGMLKTDDAFKGIVLRGVAEEYDTTFLASHLVAGSVPHFAASASDNDNDILLSARTARELGLEVGARVYAYFFAEQVKARRFRVAGIYETHLRDFDDAFVFASLHTAQQLSDWEADQCSGAELKVTDVDLLDETAASVVAAVNRREDAYGEIYSSATVRELYPSLFSWLALLDTNVYVILILMIGISIFTMTSGLLIIILERTNFIAAMKSLGATDMQLRRVFLSFAALIILRGLLIGNVLGLGLTFVQQHFGLIHLDPDTYYVDTVPLTISWPLVIAINVVTLVLSVLMLIVPSHLVARVHPARVMRFE